MVMGRFFVWGARKYFSDKGGNLQVVQPMGKVGFWKDLATGF